MGGHKTEIVQPAPPPQPTTGEAIKEWAANLPIIYETQLKYAPLQAQQEVALAQAYAQPLGEAYLRAQKAMYPETSRLQEQMAAQASRGMEEGVPEWMKREYLSNIRAELGEQAAAPIGANYVSRGLLKLNQDWQNYYRNLGLSLAGRQPLAQPISPVYTNYMGGFTPQGVMGFKAGTYGPYAAASRPLIKPGSSGIGVGGMLGGLGSFMTGLAML